MKSKPKENKVRNEFHNIRKLTLRAQRIMVSYGSLSLHVYLIELFPIMFPHRSFGVKLLVAWWTVKFTAFNTFLKKMIRKFIKNWEFREYLRLVRFTPPRFSLHSIFTARHCDELRCSMGAFSGLQRSSSIKNVKTLLLLR